MSKSSHHREENTFKFENFNERLASINVDVARRIQRVPTAAEDVDTFFVEALHRWTELNCTQDFVSFHKEIPHQFQTLAQVVHHKDEIVAVLQKHLQVSKSLALPPLLDLVVQFARDLQGDFYPYFPSFFSLIVNLLSTYHHDVEVLEHAFSCLAYLFKFLWRTMIKDIHNVYRLFCPLLSPKYRDYINKFAAESFAFLIRKVKHHSELFDFLFSTLKKETNQAAGLGRLLFEAIKGVQKQFHSVSDKIIPVLLEKLGLRKLPRDAVCNALLEMWGCMARHTSPQYAVQIWNAVLNQVQSSHEQWCGAKKRDASLLLEQLGYTLQLLLKWVKYSDGLLLQEPDNLVNCFLKLLNGPVLPGNCCDLLLELITDLLLASRCNIAPHLRPKLLQQVYDTKYSQEKLFSFSKKIFGLSLYEKDALPCLLNYLHSSVLGEDPDGCLHMLATLLTEKAPQPTEANQLENYQIYLLDFSPSVRRMKSTSCLSTHVETLLGQAVTQLPTHHDCHVLWTALVCLPHLKPLDEKACANHLKRLLPKLMNMTEDEIPEADKDNFVFLFATALFSLQQTVDENELIQMVPLDLVLGFVRQHVRNIPCLRMAALYLKQVAKMPNMSEKLKDNTFRELFPHILDNLSSPLRQIRLLTLQICVMFVLEMPELESDVQVEQVGVFRICLDVEEVELQVHSSREKLRHLRRLEYGSVQNQLPVGPYTQVPLCFLVGMLYVNFKLLWEPACELIMSHAVNLGKEEFWSVFGKHLEQTAMKTEQTLSKGNKDMTDPALHVPDDDDIGDLPSIEALFYSHQKTLLCIDERPDHVNFRHLLWQAMHKFSDVCEARSRILVPLFFRFLRNEYYPTDMNAAPSQDISVTSKSGDSEHQANDSTLNNSELEEHIEDETKAEVGKRTRRAASKTLLVHLKLFSKFKNPKVLFDESKLRDLYQELLLHGSPSIHKVAFDCIMTYNHKYLTPYKENFDRLLHDRSFKEEIVSFSVDEQTSVVKEEHREGLLPILMRILYGKMQGKTGKDTSGKNHSQLRKNIVLRFLAGCSGTELAVFLDLIFKPLKHLLSDDLCARAKHISQTVDIHSIFPLRRQQGMLETTEVVFKKLGCLIDNYLPTLLHISTCLLAQAQCLLNQERLNVHPKAIPLLKTVRQTCYARINQFFESFEHYPFSSSDIEGIFEAAIWPQIEKLPSEGLYHPTGLLKLLHTWAQYKRYMPLLGKVKDGDSVTTPLPYVFQLLHASSVNPKVVSSIMELVENLLSDVKEEVGEDEDEASLKPIDVGELVESIDPDEKTQPLGISLLLPHVPMVLLHLKSVVSNTVGHQGKVRKFPLRTLRILSRLSSFVTDGEQSKELVELLLSFLGRNIRRAEDAEIDILSTVTNLIKLVNNPGQFLDSLSKLFCCVSARASRTGLCEVVLSVADRDPSATRIANLVNKLNAWDTRYVEEPDYNVRLSAFREAQAWIKEDALQDLVVLKMIVYNCCHFINTTADMTLRDSSSYCLQELVQRIAALDSNNQLFQAIISQALLGELRTGLRSKTEETRLEYINLLSQMVKNFPERPIFCDLAHLKDPDPETDFFSNMIHIQVHRRARAMRRMIKVLESHNFSANSLMLYLHPMVNAYLRDEAYAKQQNLLDSAIDATGAICRCLPWDRYQILLKLNLAALPKSVNNQKLMVRLVVAVLDAFHFDLRHSQLLNKRNTSLSGSSVRPVDDSPEGKKVNSDETTDGVPNNKESNSDKLESSEEGNEMDVEDEEGTHTGEDSSVYIVRLTETSVTPSGMHLCSESLATKIHQLILEKLLPDLHKLLTKKSKSDEEHKAARPGKYAEDEEVLRVPIALAMVKLLKNLPHKTLENNLPNVLLKVCHFLKSRAQDVRESSQDTLVKIMQTLGVKHLGYVLKELRGTLTRGYQLHVLGFTVHALLTSLVPTLAPGDLDKCAPVIVQVCNGEIFGAVAEEKEVEGIRGKLVEARSTKSYDSYAVLARFVTASSLIHIIQPQQEILSSTHSHKVALKVQEVLSKVNFGLVENAGLELHSLLTFIFGIATEALPLLKPKQKNKGANKSQHPGQAPPSVFLIQRENPRGGSKPKTHTKTNMHIIVEFGIQLLYMLLKKSRLNSGEIEHLQLLDPMIPILSSSLTAKHIKVTVTALRCLAWLLKFPLPALKDHISTITDSLFLLLSTYATSGSKGDSQELVFTTFKTMTVLVRDVTFHSISADQLQVLLQYAEQDIHDHTRQATAFNLLKAILSRKLVLPEMGDVMKKVEQLSITSESAHVRLQSRQVALQFMLDYPLGKQVQHHTEFYLLQLSYEHESGRESALEMIATIFSTFPQGHLKKNAGLFFVSLARCLVNDESTKCRKLAALAIKSLLSKLETESRDELFTICIEWFKDHKVILHRLASLACGLLVEVESAKFERHMKTVLPIIEEQIKPENFDEDSNESAEREQDQLLFGVLNLLVKILHECPGIPRKKPAMFSRIFEYVTSHLLFAHEWVRLASAQLFGLLFTSWTPQDLVQAANSSKQDYLLNNTQEKIHTLCGAFTKQLSSPQLNPELAEQVIKNLVFLGKVLKLCPDEKTLPPKEDEAGNADKSPKEATLTWLVRRLVRLAKTEASTTSKITIKRISIFKWMAAMSLDLGSELLPRYLPSLLPSLVIEATNTSATADPEMTHLSQEVLDLMKQTVGIELFNAEYAVVHQIRTKKKENRKRQEAQDVMINPEVAAHKRMKKNLQKREAKKRKAEDYRPSKKLKAKKHSQFTMKDS